MSWRVALIDSCGSWPRARASAAFARTDRGIECRAPVVDPTGHGSRIAALLTAGDDAMELLLGQVFLNAEPTSAAAVAAALDWSLSCGARLVHLSLGIARDRPVLGDAVREAVAAGAIIVASTPARGVTAFPASYPGVIQATGDARCAPGEISRLAPMRFGGCPRPSPALAGHTEATPVRGGASIGAAWVSKAIVSLQPAASTADVVKALNACAIYCGPERRGTPTAIGSS